MKKILGLTIAALLVMAMVAGGTYAYFSDTETSTGNIITAGTLNLVPATSGSGTMSQGGYTVTAGGDGVNGKVVIAKAAPGDAGVAQWTLYNDGNLNGVLTVVSTVTFADNGNNEPEAAVTVPHANDGGGNGDLDEFLGVKLQRGVGTDQGTAEAAMGYLLGAAGYYVPASGLEAALDDAVGQDLQALGGNDYIVYKLSWSIASDIETAGVNGQFGTGGDDLPADDNIIQSDMATIDITFTLDQDV